MTEQTYRDMLLTAAMQARLATAGASRTSVSSLAKAVGAIGSGVAESAYVSASWLEFRDHSHVSIQGTDDMYDWVQNLSAHQVRVGALSCHEGFLRASNIIRAEIIISLGCPLHKPIVIGGHSAGGSIAEVLSAQMTRVRFREIVTFGAPRVWSAESAPRARAINPIVHRFVIPGDPVPALPFRNFRRLFGKAQYSHASQPLELTADGRVLLDRGNSTLRKAIRIGAGAWLYGLASVGLVREWMPTLLDRHYLSNYRQRIQSALERIESQ